MYQTEKMPIKIIVTPRCGSPGAITKYINDFYNSRATICLKIVTVLLAGILSYLFTSIIYIALWDKEVYLKRFPLVVGVVLFILLVITFKRMIAYVPFLVVSKACWLQNYFDSVTIAKWETYDNVLCLITNRGTVLKCDFDKRFYIDDTTYFEINYNSSIHVSISLRLL